jgi:hypothetical protein
LLKIFLNNLFYSFNKLFILKYKNQIVFLGIGDFFENSNNRHCRLCGKTPAKASAGPQWDLSI